MIRITICLFLTFSILGCTNSVQTQSPAPVRQVVSAPSVQIIPINEIIQLLETGQSHKANVALYEFLRLHPGHQTAKLLFDQLQQDPEERYGAQSINYRIRSGDTLGVLAKRHLGNSLEFYGLARYNNISDPRKLKTGQLIKIPVKPSAELRENSLITHVEKLLTQNQYFKVIQTLAGASELVGFENKAMQLLESAFLGVEQQQPSFEQLVEFQGQLSSLPKHNSFLSSTIEKYKKTIESKIRFHKSRQSLDSDNLQDAYDNFLLAYKLHSQLNNSQVSLKSTITEALHRNAIVHFRNQELERSIALWDQVLTLDPKHESAKSFRNRAIKLNSQLKNIDG